MLHSNLFSTLGSEWFSKNTNLTRMQPCLTFFQYFPTAPQDKVWMPEFGLWAGAKVKILIIHEAEAQTPERRDRKLLTWPPWASWIRALLPPSAVWSRAIHPPLKSYMASFLFPDYNIKCIQPLLSLWCFLWLLVWVLFFQGRASLCVVCTGTHYV